MSMFDVRSEGGERTICFSFQIYGRCHNAFTARI
nr:MAG TPA: hypothetical protein [Caudoviricetes sp.]